MKTGPSAQASGARPRRKPRAKREQATSEFGAILEAFLARVPGARSAALVDFEGETVD